MGTCLEMGLRRVGEKVEGDLLGISLSFSFSFFLLELSLLFDYQKYSRVGFELL